MHSKCGGNFEPSSFVGFINKRPAERRDIFRPKLFYNYINLRLKNSQCTKNKCSKKKALIHLSPFLKATPNLLFLQKLPTFCNFGTMQLTARRETFRRQFSKNIFSQILNFEHFCKGNMFPESLG